MELNQCQRPAQHPCMAQDARNCTHCGKPMRIPASGAMLTSAPTARTEPKPKAEPVRRIEPIQKAGPAPKAGPIENPAPRTHFAAYAQEYILRLPAEQDAAATLPLRPQRTAGGFCAEGELCADAENTECAAVIPAEGYYICLWETGVTKAEGAAALELGVNGGGSRLAERLEPGYYSGQQYTWFNRDDCVTLRLRKAGDAEEGAETLVEGGTAQLTLIRLG